LAFDVLGDQNELPPEPGFARREAHSDKNPPKRERLGRLREPFPLATARKERAHGGTRGSPVLIVLFKSNGIAAWDVAIAAAAIERARKRKIGLDI